MEGGQGEYWLMLPKSLIPLENIESMESKHTQTHKKESCNQCEILYTLNHYLNVLILEEQFQNWIYSRMCWQVKIPLNILPLEM